MHFENLPKMYCFQKEEEEKEIFHKDTKQQACFYPATAMGL